MENWKQTKTHKFSLAALSLSLTRSLGILETIRHNARFYDSKSDFSDSLMIIRRCNSPALFYFILILQMVKNFDDLEPNDDN